MIYFSNKMHDCHAFHIREDQPIPEEFPVHAHMVRIEIFCIVSGKARYIVEGNIYHPQPGDLLISAPGETHRIELDSSVPYERMVVIFDPQMLSGLDPEGKLTQAILSKQPGIRNHFTAKEAGNISWAERMSRFMTAAPENRLNAIAGISQLLQQILTALSKEKTQPAPDGLTAQILRYINQHLAEPLSLQQLCDHFYISRAQLCRLFRNATGTSVGGYITTKRMLLARQLICQGSKPTLIYQQCGYRDYSAFFRAYCKYHGHPPKEDQSPSPITEDQDLVSL